MDKHPIQGEEEILLVTPCYRNWNKYWPSTSELPFASFSERVLVP